jgi:hypothetical protein
MGKRNRSKPTAPESAPATALPEPDTPVAGPRPEAPKAPPRAGGDDLGGKPSPAQDVPTGLDPEDARSLRKAAVFFVSAIALIVVLKLLLGW